MSKSRIEDLTVSIVECGVAAYFLMYSIFIYLGFVAQYEQVFAYINTFLFVGYLLAIVNTVYKTTKRLDDEDSEYLKNTKILLFIIGFIVICISMYVIISYIPKVFTPLADTRVLDINAILTCILISLSFMSHRISNLLVNISIHCFGEKYMYDHSKTQ